MEEVIDTEENTEAFRKISVFVTMERSACAFSVNTVKFEDTSFGNTVRTY